MMEKVRAINGSFNSLYVERLEQAINDFTKENHLLPCIPALYLPFMCSSSQAEIVMNYSGISYLFTYLFFCLLQLRRQVLVLLTKRI